MKLTLEQSPAYHLFADDRGFCGIANAANTFSNAGFVLAGLLGLALLWRNSRASGTHSFQSPEEKRAWWVVFAAVLLTGFGSGWYHLAPDDARLVWDRMPMAVAFMALVAATLSDRVAPALGRRLLLPLVTLGLASVAWWQATGNLLPYVVIQFGAMLVIFAIVMSRRSRYTHGSHMLAVLATYLAAKAAESMDASLYSLGGLVSGHTLKHLLAAGSVLYLWRMLSLRSPQ